MSTEPSDDRAKSTLERRYTVTFLLGGNHQDDIRIFYDCPHRTVEECLSTFAEQFGAETTLGGSVSDEAGTYQVGMSDKGVTLMNIKLPIGVQMTTPVYRVTDRDTHERRAEAIVKKHYLDLGRSDWADKSGRLTAA